MARQTNLFIYMPDSIPNSPTDAKKIQPAGHPKFHFQSPGNYLPTLRTLSMGDEDFHIEGPTLAVPQPRTVPGHGGLALHPYQEQIWAYAPAPAAANNGLPAPGLVTHGRPQLAPIDISMAMGSPHGHVLEDFETLVVSNSHSHQPPDDNVTLQLPPQYVQSLEAALTGCCLDDRSQPFDSMGD